MNVAIYARVSLQEQAASDYSSVDAQVDCCRAHCAHQTAVTGSTWTVCDVYRDEGFSGRNTERPALTALLEAVKGGRYDAIIVYKLDRATRSLYDYLNLDATLQRHHCALVSVREQFDTTTPIGRAMRALLLVFAQLERETLVQRVMDKHTALMAAGRYVGGHVPYGYRMVDGELQIHPEQSPIVLRIFTEFANGRSTLTIARGLNADGVPSQLAGRKFKGGIQRGLWSPSALVCVLKAVCHRGIMRYGDRTGKWPAPTFVPPALVEAVDARIEMNRGTRGPKRVRHDLHGLFRCSECGGTLQQNSVSQRNGVRRVYLYCRDTRIDAGPQCASSHVRMEELAPISGAILAMIERCRPGATPPEPEGAAARRVELAARRERANDLYLDGRIPRDRWQQIVTACDDEEQALCPQRSGDIDPTDLNAEWPRLSVGKRNAILARLVRAIIVYPDRFEVITLPTEWDGWEPGITIRR
ncbi:MAG TPA: recombinase family protein [Armatimonadota bacterium]|jgi:DNA invertase Pin-like site-specific DNA recombinase